MFRQILFLFFIISFLNACSPKEKCNCNSLPSVEKFNDSVMQKNLPGFKKFLNKFDEKSIEEEDHIVIRFSIYGAFGDIKFYRIEQTENSYVLITKLFKSESMESAKDSMIENNIRSLSENEIQPILKLINDSCFWTMYATELKRSAVLDGSGLILEVYDPEGNACTQKKYHVVIQSSAEQPGYRSICEKIINLDPLKKEFH